MEARQDSYRAATQPGSSESKMLLCVSLGVCHGVTCAGRGRNGICLPAMGGLRDK